MIYFMDYYDIKKNFYTAKSIMQKWTNIAYLADSLWSLENEWRRSEELTPLYIERYRGPQINNKTGSHSFWELVCVISGNGILQAEKNPILHENMILMIPPGIKHYESSTEILDSIWIGLKGSKLPENMNEILYLSNSALTKKIISLWRLAEQHHEYIGTELDGRIQVILGQFFRLIKQNKNSDNNSLSYAIQYMQDNFYKQISFSDLAASARCSEGHFYRSFKQLTGKTPSLFLTSIRIRHACHLLQHSNFTLAEIAHLSGYQEQFYFSRIFKKYTGLSPSLFRRNS